ncbi:MAG: hypothetical protein NTX56_06890 [Proteobacteria bacterium]|nr:hypothetical protein [Pseudomonadota bacterium]
MASVTRLGYAVLRPTRRLTYATVAKRFTTIEVDIPRLMGP